MSATDPKWRAQGLGLGQFPTSLLYECAETSDHCLRRAATNELDRRGEHGRVAPTSSTTRASKPLHTFWLAGQRVEVTREGGLYSYTVVARAPPSPAGASGLQRAPR